MFNSASKNALSLARILFVLLITVSAGACGYKGPLYLPPPPDTLKGLDNSTKQTALPTSDPSQPSLSVNEDQLLEPRPVLIE